MSNTGMSSCVYCGAEFRLFSIMNRGCMQALTRNWKRKHEWRCEKRTPKQRRQWAKKYEGLDYSESSITVDLGHSGFQEGEQVDGLVVGDSNSSQVLSDEELDSAFNGTNFGTVDRMELLAASVFKKALGQECGHTITVIMKELNLIGAGGSVLKRGRQMLNEHYSWILKKGG